MFLNGKLLSYRTQHANGVHSIVVKSTREDKEMSSALLAHFGMAVWKQHEEWCTLKEDCNVRKLRKLTDKLQTGIAN